MIQKFNKISSTCSHHLQQMRRRLPSLFYCWTETGLLTMAERTNCNFFSFLKLMGGTEFSVGCDRGGMILSTFIYSIASMLKMYMVY